MRRSVPSLFDLQVNGFAGVDFQRPDLTAAELRRAVDALRSHGILRILFTLITDETDALCSKLERVEAMAAKDPIVRETIAGYHLEGPWLSAETGYCGAHPPAKMCDPAEADLERLIGSAQGNVKLITLAPERSGSTEVIAAARRRGVVVSLGHTCASEAEIDLAIRAGATLCTHLGNGVPAVLPRHDNVVQRLLARDELTACFIPDGLHLPPFVLRNFFRAKPAGRALLTSDCMAAAGAAPGRYTVGPITVDVGADGVVREPGKPNFAGSSLLLGKGVDNAARWLGVTPEEARSLASTRVAEVFKVNLPTIEMEITP